MILYIEDDPEHVEMFRRFVTTDVDVVLSPIGAMFKLGMNDYDFIICDLMIPSYQPKEMIDDLKSVPGKHKLIVLTSMDRKSAEALVDVPVFMKGEWDSLKKYLAGT